MNGRKEFKRLALSLLILGLLAFGFSCPKGRALGRPESADQPRFLKAWILEDLWNALTNPVETIEEWLEGIGEFFEGLTDIFDGVGEWFSGVFDFFDGVFDWFGGGLEAIGEWLGGLPGRFAERFRKLTTAAGDPQVLVSGGYSLWAGELPGRIQIIFNIFQPVGMVILIICWAIRVGATGIDRSLDFGIRNSAATVAVQLLIGMVVMSVGPQLIMQITGLSYNLTLQLAGQMGNAAFGDLWHLSEAVEGALSGSGGTLTGILDAIDALNNIDAGGFFGKMIFFYLIQFTFILNIAYMAVLCGVSPLFIGFAAGGESTKRVALNFLKEFIKTALVPPMVFAYATIAFSLMDQVGLMFSGLVIGISCVGFAKNKLDRLLG